MKSKFLVKNDVQYFLSKLFQRYCNSIKFEVFRKKINLLLLGRFTVNKVNFFLNVENNSKNVETKFNGRRISIDEVIKSINVNFLLFRSIFTFLLFLRDSTLC